MVSPSISPLSNNLTVTSGSFTTSAFISSFFLVFRISGAGTTGLAAGIVGFSAGGRAVTRVLSFGTGTGFCATGSLLVTGGFVVTSGLVVVVFGLFVVTGVFVFGFGVVFTGGFLDGSTVVVDGGLFTRGCETGGFGLAVALLSRKKGSR